MDNTRQNMSILFIPFGTERVAATRYRVYQYLPYLKSQNIKYKVFSIISDATTKKMINSPNFIGLRKIMYYSQVVFEKIVRFVPVLVLSKRYKILFFQRTTFPFGLEKLLKVLNKNIVFDIDDAIFLPDNKESGLIGRIKEYTKAVEVADMLKVSKISIVENEYIRVYVKKYCPKVFLISGPIDTQRNFVKERKSDKEVTIGWIGSPSTAIYLNMLDNVFRKISDIFNVKIMLIGAGHYKLGRVEINNIEWSLKNEVSQLQEFDIGVMPMPDNEWTRGKLGCKMLQYMAVGVPAVVSYTPTNAEVIIDGVNGFLVNSEEEWMQKLSLLIGNPALRKNIGINGRKTVEERFSLEINAPKFLEILLESILNTDSH